MNDDQRPVLVGVAQSCFRDARPASASDPLSLLEGVARAAAEDSGAGGRALRELDTLGIVEVAAWRPRSGPRLLSERLGASPRNELPHGDGRRDPDHARERSRPADRRGKGADRAGRRRERDPHVPARAARGREARLAVRRGRRGDTLRRSEAGVVAARGGVRPQHAARHLSDLRERAARPARPRPRDAPAAHGRADEPLHAGRGQESVRLVPGRPQRRRAHAARSEQSDDRVSRTPSI